MMMEEPMSFFYIIHHQLISKLNSISNARYWLVVAKALYYHSMHWSLLPDEFCEVELELKKEMHCVCVYRKESE